VSGGPVVLDLQALQSCHHGERGIGRWALAFTSALCAARPDLVGGIVLNERLPVPAAIEPLLGTGLVARSGELELRAGQIYHLLSPFELDETVEGIWPAAARESPAALAVTLYDLIPGLFAGQYLADPGQARRYRTRQELVRAADRVLAISETTRRDAIDRLGLRPERVVNVGAGIAPEFVPAASRAEAQARAAAAVPGLTAPFLLSVGGEDARKNLEGLLAGYAALEPALRRRHQLVIACRLSDGYRAQLAATATALGIGPRVLLTGYVDDATLIALYQSTELFVFPSRYEGYGLPVAEAMACGAPVVGSNTSATAELVDPAGAFDPDDPAAIARAITRALADESTRRALAAASAAPPPTWAAAAARAAAVYEELLSSPAPAPRSSIRVGVVTPLPPQPTGVASYTARLLEALAGVIAAHAAHAGSGHAAPVSTGSARPGPGPEARMEVDVFLDALEAGPAALVPAPRVPDGFALHPVETLERVEAARGGYDVMVYAIGNSEFHTGALAAARRRPGIVLAHDVALGQLYAFAAHHGVLAPAGEGSFAGVLAAWYPERHADLAALPDPLLVDPKRFATTPVALARELIAASRAFLTTSRYAASLARLDAIPGDEGRIGTLVHACRLLRERPDPAGELVVTFGVVNEAKEVGTLIDAFARVHATRPRARLVFAGHGSAQDLAAVAARAQSAGVAGAVEATGALADDQWDAWLSRATIAVQLRRGSQGEFSGAVAEALAAGIPTIVTGLGSAAELPADAAVAVPPGVDAAALAAEISALLGDPARRRALAAAARRFAASRSFPAIAEELYAWILAAARRPPAARSAPHLVQQPEPPGRQPARAGAGNREGG
jgi:glycosyltransferase involved in cell wall biosynthesis